MNNNNTFQNLSVSESLTVDGSSEFRSDLHVRGNLQVDGSSYSFGSHLSVDGPLTISDSLGVGTNAPSHKLHVRTHDAVGLFESTGSQAYLRLSTREGLEHRVEIANRPGGRLSLWTRRGGDVLNITRNGNLGIGTAEPTHRFHVKTGDAVGLFESVGSQAYLRLSTTEGLDHRVEIANRPGGRLSLWTRRGGDVLNITRDGNLGIGTTTPTHRFHVKTGDAVGLFESVGSQAFLRLATREGHQNRVEITNRPGGVLTLWTSGAGDAFRIEKDGKIHIGRNVTGPFVQFNDDLWFRDPQNGTIETTAGNGRGWGKMVGHFRAPSSIEYKKDVTSLRATDYQDLLDDVLKTDLVHYKYKEDRKEQRRHLGVVVEECPAYLVGDDGKSLSTVEYISMLHGAIKALAQLIEQNQPQL